MTILSLGAPENGLIWKGSYRSSSCKSPAVGKYSSHLTRLFKDPSSLVFLGWGCHNFSRQMALEETNSSGQCNLTLNPALHGMEEDP